MIQFLGPEKPMPRRRIERRRSRKSMALLTSIALLAACGRTAPPLPDLTAAAIGDTAGLLQRGEYIVRNVAVCGHCHAAEAEDPDGPLSGGNAFRSWRLGTIRASNLTPDSATGLGRWGQAEIARAIRAGVDREGRLLAPVMPYAWFHGMSIRDAAAVARYLQSLEPVRNEVESHLNLVYRLGRALFLSPETPTDAPAPPAAPTAEYGRYLANHVSLCADCHTPHGGLRSTPDRSRLFAGDATPRSGFPANPSNLTPDTATGIGGWTEDDFLRTIRTGVNVEGDTLHRFMPWREIRRMREDDLRAIYRYLRTLEPIRNEVPRRAPGEA